MTFEEIKWVDQNDDGRTMSCRMPDGTYILAVRPYASDHCLAVIFPKSDPDKKRPFTVDPTATEKVADMDTAKLTAFNMWKVLSNEN